MAYKYAFDQKEQKDNLVKVVGVDIGISSKQAIEICAYIKGLSVENAKNRFELVLEKKLAIPYKRFTEGAGHKKGIGSGKYPITAVKQFLILLNSLEANAQNKGLGTNLKIIHACANKASTPVRHGRKRGIEMKRAHVEIVAQEVEQKNKQHKQEAKIKVKSDKVKSDNTNNQNTQIKKEEVKKEESK